MPNVSLGKWLAGSANRLEIIGQVREVLLDADGPGWSCLVLAGRAVIPVLPPEGFDWHPFQQRGTWVRLTGTLENDKLTRMRTMHYLRAQYMERLEAPFHGGISHRIDERRVA